MIFVGSLSGCQSKQAIDTRAPEFNDHVEKPTSDPCAEYYQESDDFSFHWIRSVSPDLNVGLKSQPARAQLFVENDSPFIYTLTNSALMKTKSNGNLEWLQGYWKNHDISSDGFLDGLEYRYLQFTPDGNIVTVGNANTNDLPAKNKVNSAIRKGIYPADDGFIACYTPKGEVLWAYYFGGSEKEVLYNLFIDSSGIYVCGGTASSDFPITASDSKDPSKSTFILVKFSFNGELMWSKSYLQDIIIDNGKYNRCTVEDAHITTRGITLLCRADHEGLPLIQGSSKATPRTFSEKNDTNIRNAPSKTSFDWETYDCYLIHLDFDGNIQWSTYLGGSDDEFFGNFLYGSPRHNTPMSVYDEERFYIIGETLSLNYPLKNALQDTINPGCKTLDEWWNDDEVANPNGCPFITCFSYTGELLWSTYFGGPALTLTDACVKQGQLYLAGTVKDAVLPEGSGNTAEFYYGHSDGILAQINADGNLVWSTYFGGENNDTIDAMKVVDETIYFTGVTESSKLQLKKTHSSSFYLASIDPHKNELSIGSCSFQIEKMNIFMVNPNTGLSEEVDADSEYSILDVSFHDLMILQDDTIYTTGVINIWQNGLRTKLFKDYENIPEATYGIYFLSQWKIK